jgi:hypothetical protein
MLAAVYFLHSALGMRLPGAGNRKCSIS